MNYKNQTYLIIEVSPRDNASKYPSKFTEPERHNKIYQYIWQVQCFQLQNKVMYKGYWNKSNVHKRNKIIEKHIK